MSLLDDYLRAVSRLLPRSKRDDIVAELRDEVMTRLEARESELGRALSDDETEQLLRDFGHPIVVAARYQDGPQYSVGPALYPYWIFAIRFAIILELCVSGIVFIARVIGGANFADAVSTAIGSGLTGAFTLIGFATVAAWVIERRGIDIDYFKTWRVRDLGFLDFAFWDWADISEWVSNMDRSKRGGARTSDAAPKDGYGYSGYGATSGHGYHGWAWRQSSAGRGVGAITVGVVFILWWMGVISFGLRPVPVDFGAMQVNPGALADINYTQLKASLYWPVLGYFAALILLGATVLIYPRGVRMRGLIDIVMGLSVMAFVAWVWTASPIAEAVRVENGSELFQRIKAFLEHPVPVPLETLVTVFLIFVAFGGFCRALGGLWEVLTGAPRYPGDA